MLLHPALPSEHLHGSEPCPLFDDCVRALPAGTVLSRLSRDDGTSFPAEICAHPILRDGLVTGTVVSVSDISLRCQAQRALRESQEQFRQAQKMEAVGRLAGGVAHDFNNLLTVIIGYSDLLLKRMGVNVAGRAEISEIRAAGIRAADLTRQLLAFSRRQALQPKIVEIGSVISTMKNLLVRLIREDIELDVKSEGYGRVWIDPGQLEQVVMNLVVNARDALPSGGRIGIDASVVEVDAAAARRHACKPGSFVLLAVTDNGCGMSREVLSRIFEPFFTTKPKGKGTGLGLATVYGIVSQSRGYLQVSSEPGKGSTFQVFLPLVAEAGEPVVEAATASPLPRGGETLLVVEDEAALLPLTRQVLESEGYTVQVASGGSEAIRMLQANLTHIDLVITDVVMPGMSGPEMATRLVSLKPGLKVLFVSGYADDAMLESQLLQGSAHFLQKPFTPDILARKVRETLCTSATPTGRAG